MQRRSIKHQRGATAVEFAIVAPVFLLAIGFIVSVSTTMWSRFEIGNQANLAARACVLRLPMLSPSAIKNCTEDKFNSRVAAHAPFGCTNPHMVSTVSATASPRVDIVEMSITCDMQWLGMMLAFQTPSDAANVMLIRSEFPYSR